MAISFNKLKSPKLGLTDIITFGKLKDCRVCDVVQDHYDYLIWAEKQGYVKFNKEVEVLICETASFERWEAPVEDSEPRDIFEISSKHQNGIFDDDVPF